MYYAAHFLHDSALVASLRQRYHKTLMSDILAGMTGAVAGAPQAMGFAIIAGVNPVYGLYSAIIATIVGAFTSSSALMTIGPTNALALVVGSTLTAYPGSTYIEPMVVLTVLVGIFQVLFSVLRLGFLTRFVSNAVMTGFITGAGLLIIVGQLRHLTGYEAETAVQGVLPRFWDWLTHFSQSDVQTTIIGLAATVTIFSLHHTRFKSVATLVAIIVTTVWVSVFGWHEVAIVRDLAPIPNSLPGLTLPDPAYAPDLLVAALAIAVLSVIQSTGITRTIPQPDGSLADENRDFLAQGVSNIVGGLFRGMPAGGSLSRTAVNVSAGARTRLANILAGVFVGLILLSLGSLIERVTLAALAGHLVVAAFSLINFKNLLVVWRVNWTARISMSITFLSTLVLPLEYSVYVGVGISLLLYAYTSANNIHIARLVSAGNGHFREVPIPDKLPDAEPVIFTVSGNLYFAGIKRLEEMLPLPAGVTKPVVILRLRNNEYMGSTGLNYLQRYARRLWAQDGLFILAGVGPEVYHQLERTGALDVFGRENVFDSHPLIFGATEEALARAEAWLTQDTDDSTDSPPAP